MKRKPLPILGAFVVSLSAASVVQAGEPQGAGHGGQPLEATTVKSSKSNSQDRLGGPEGSAPAAATTVKSSKSNSSERLGGPSSGPPAAATTVKGTKSNSDN